MTHEKQEGKIGVILDESRWEGLVQRVGDNPGGGSEEYTQGTSKFSAGTQTVLPETFVFSTFAMVLPCDR